MLPRVHRLTTNELLQVRQHGRQVSCNNVRLRFLPSDQGKYAIMVPKSVDRRATVRNRQRRLVSEAIRLLIPTKAPPVMGIITLFQPFQTNSIDEASDTIVELFHRSGIHGKISNS